MLHSSTFMHIKLKIHGFFFRGLAPEHARSTLVCRTGVCPWCSLCDCGWRLQRLSSRCFGGRAIMLGMLRCWNALLWALVSWVGSGEDDVKSNSALLAARVPPIKLRTFSEVSRCRQITFCCLLVEKQSLSACKTSLCCVGVEVFGLV